MADIDRNYEKSTFANTLFLMSFNAWLTPSMQAYAHQIKLYRFPLLIA